MKLSTGGIAVRLHACDGLVSTVELHLARDVDVVRWRVDAPAGSPIDRFTVGETPAGFMQTIALLEAPKRGTRYFLNAQEPNRVLHVGGVTFDPAELETDVWLVGLDGGNKKLTDEEFDRLDPC